MSRRAASYPPAGATTHISGGVWRSVIETMREYGVSDGGSEALVFLGGVVADGHMIVTGLYRLGHAAQGERVEVTPAESRWLLGTLRERDEKLVGQVHSHRGIAGHSPGDDAWATSFHQGFLSVVVPGYGASVTGIGSCAVFEFRDRQFAALSPTEVAERIAIFEEIVDRLPAIRVKERRWTRFVTRLKQTGRKRP